MKLAILGSRGIPARYGGFEIFAEQLATGLVERGWQVTVYCPADQEYREASYRGVDLHFVRHPDGVFGTIMFDAACIRNAARSGFDVGLLLGYGASPFLRLARMKGLPMAVNMDGLEWKRSKWTWYARAYLRYAERTAVRLADALVSDAPGIQRYFRETYGRDSACIAYGTELPEGPVPDIPGEYDLRPDEYYIVVMRLEPENSIREIVEGYLASNARRDLLIVGSRTPFFDAEVAHRLNESSRGGGRIHFIGTVYDRDKLYALRANARAYIHGHTVGGTNPSLLDAMAARNLIIARDVEFNRDLAGESAFFFDTATDLSTIIDTVEAMRCEEVGRRGAGERRIIEEHYRWNTIVDQYATFLKGVARRRSSRSPV